MVHGRQGMKLEAFKFSVYILIPVGASLTFNDPNVQRWAADYFQFLKYPANPNTNLKGEFEALVEKTKKEKEARREYAAQMQKLQEGAQKRAQEEQLQASRQASRQPLGRHSVGAMPWRGLLSHRAIWNYI